VRPADTVPSDLGVKDPSIRRRWSVADGDERRERRPLNLLFILVDCLGSHLAFGPRPRMAMPGFDRLLSDGIAFPTCIATATTTSPSIATLFTGALPFVHGVRSLHGFKLTADVATLAEIVRDHGFATRAETVGPVVSSKGFDRGFDVFEHRAHTTNLSDDTYWAALQSTLGGLAERSPWFCYLHLWELHRPRVVPPGFRGRAAGRSAYQRSLTALAAKLERIVELAGPDTLIVLTGDHGEIARFDTTIGVASRLRLRPVSRFLSARSGHGVSVVEDLVRVPLILSGPDVPHGVRVDTAVRHMDVLPTILDVLGVEDPRTSQIRGESLRPLFAGPGSDRPGYSEAVGVTMPGGPERWLVSVRHDGWKYVRNAAGSQRILWKLPDERTDHAAREPAVVERMEALMSELQAGRSLAATGEDLSADESDEMEAHLRDLGYIE
jgi:arylsulfatase A-like enzyme